MVGIVRLVLLFLVTLQSTGLFAQNDPSPLRYQRLRLNITWEFLYVVKQKKIDRDSALTASSRQLDIDRLILITENDQLLFSKNRHFVSSKEELEFLKGEIPSYSGSEKIRLYNAIAWMYTFEQGILKNNLDSARLYLEKGNSLAEHQHDRNGLDENLSYWGLYYYKAEDIKAGDSCLLAAVTQSNKSGNKIGEARALSIKGVYYPLGQHSKERIECLEKALALYRELNDREMQVLTLLNAAYLHGVNNQWKDAESLSQESLNIQHEIGFPYAQFTYELLKLISVVEKNDREVESKALEAIKVLGYIPEKEEVDFALLTQLSRMSLKKSSLMHNIIIGATVLLLLLIVALLYLKLKTNRKLKKQQNEINVQNQLLKEYGTAQQKLVEDKEWLIKEIHHRVKNNLQMIISLLNAQSEFLDHPLALNAIKESRERMQAVALIHQKLYQPGQGTAISMLSYIQEMVNYLGSSFADARRISIKLTVDDIKLDVSQAVPLGLILNEAITNAVKYAFPAGQPGTVNILLRHREAGTIELQINDNGQGLPNDFDLSANNSLGIQLMQLFAEQLEGKLQLTSVQGVAISLTFRQFHPENKNTSLLNIG